MHMLQPAHSGSSQTKASDELLILLGTSDVWGRLIRSKFVDGLQEAARRASGNDGITLRSDRDVFLLCCAYGVNARTLMSRIFGLGVIKKLGHADILPTLNQGAVDAVTLICYVLAERMSRDYLAEVGTIRSVEGRLRVPVKDQVLAIIVGTANLSEVDGERMYGGAVVRDGQLVIPGAISVIDSTFELRHQSGLDGVAEQIAESCYAFEHAVPSAKPNKIIYGKKGNEAEWSNDGLKDHIQGDVLDLRESMQAIHGVACDLVFTFEQREENQPHLLSADSKRQQIEEFFGVPTLVHGRLNGAPDLDSLETELRSELKRLLKQIPTLPSNERTGQSKNIGEEFMPITTLAVSFAAEDQSDWDLMRPRLQASLDAHANEQMRNLKIWTFRKIAGGQNDSEVIQGKFRDEASAGLLLVSINACGRSYIQKDEWPLFRDTAGKVLKPFVAVMFSPVNASRVNLGVLARNSDGNRTQLLHVLGPKNKIFSWKDCVNHELDTGVSAWCDLFIFKMVDDLEEQLFGVVR